MIENRHAKVARKRGRNFWYLRNMVKLKNKTKSKDTKSIGIYLNPIG